MSTKRTGHETPFVLWPKIFIKNEIIVINGTGPGARIETNVAPGKRPSVSEYAFSMDFKSPN
jgi:hypothetical protein